MKEDNSDNIYVDLTRVPLKSEREEKRKKRKHVLLTILLCVFFLIVGVIGGLTYDKILHSRMKADVSNTFGEIEAMISNFWLYGNDYDDLQNTLEDKAFYGMTKFDDDVYTSYMSQEELDDFSSTINMDYVGIGVQYSLQDNKGIIQRVYKGSPAESAGLIPGDMMIAVDGIDVQNLTTSEIKELVIGKEGTQVVISILRDNKPMDISVIRGEVDNSAYCYVQDDYVVLELASFGENTGKAIMNYLNQYEDYEKIIIDLRDNTGGYQTSVKEIAGLFIGNNKVYLKQADKNGYEVSDLTSCIKTYDNFKNIVLLVNGNTASAAEVFTICLKEQLPNVTVVGKTTFGKGVIQSTHSLANGGALKFTTYYWYSPNGVSIHNEGIKPDIEVSLDDIAYETVALMQEDKEYKYDEVAEDIKTAQMCLNYLDYTCNRQDGYFDDSFLTALNNFKVDNELDPNGILDKETYDIIISHVINGLANKDKDYQMQKAIELMADGI